MVTRPPLIQVQNLNFFYGDFRALARVNLEIPAGGITSIIGPKGCGKSTFLRLLNRMNDLVPGTRIEGKVLLHGVNLYDSGISVVELRRRVGMVFQKPNPFPKSIYENVAYGPRLHGVNRRHELDALVEDSLKKASIWEELKDILPKSALTLSGGQQQRLCIARAVAMNPEIILMDEPTRSLDPIATSRIEELTQQLKEDYTVIMVTHNMQQASRLSDHTAFFYMGRLVEFGDTQIMFTRPKEQQTEQYITGRFG